MAVKKPREDAHFFEASTRNLPSSTRDGSRRRGGQAGNRNAEKRGFWRLKTAVRELGARAIDRRTRIGKALAAWRRDLEEDLGGPEALTTQKRALVDLAVRTKLMLDSIDAWILEQRSLVDRKRRALLPVVRERQSLVATLRQILVDLGLERRLGEPLDLRTYLAVRTASRPTDGTQADVEAEGPAEGDSESEAGS